MTIASMTGFGRAEAAGKYLNVTVEIKSVNNRFKDYRFRMPSFLSSIEIELRKQMDQYFKRGTFDISINTKKVEIENNNFDIDEIKVNEFIRKIKSAIGSDAKTLQINAVDFLRKEFFVDDTQTKEQEMPDLVRQALKEACENLVKTREEEGNKLIGNLKTHRKDYENFFNKVQSLRSGYEMTVKEKLKKKFEENKESINVDEGRFLQEVIYYLEKLDVDEEINRIKSHLKKFDSLLAQNDELGRQLDFLVQELNRETNTIGSKSAHTEVSENVVQMKVQLEKIREQALNLE